MARFKPFDVDSIDVPLGRFQNLDADAVRPCGVLARQRDASHFGEDKSGDDVEITIVGEVVTHRFVDLTDMRPSKRRADVLSITPISSTTYSFCRWVAS